MTLQDKITREKPGREVLAQVKEALA
jgi:hypothetical protein